MGRLLSISRCPRLTTGTYPNRKGMILPAKMSTTSVPWSLYYVRQKLSPTDWETPEMEAYSTYIKSTLVKTPIVLVPSGSQSLAIFNPSELAKSVLAAVTAKIIEFGFMINLSNISRICFSISRGWSPTGTYEFKSRESSVRFCMPLARPSNEPL